MTSQCSYNRRSTRTVQERGRALMHAIMHVSDDVVFTMDTSGFCNVFSKPHLPPPCERNYSIKYPFINGCITRLKCGDSGEPPNHSPPPTLFRDYNLRCIKYMCRRAKDRLGHHTKVPNDSIGVRCDFSTTQIALKPPILRFIGAPPTEQFFSCSRPPGYEQNFHQKIYVRLLAEYKKSYWRKNRKYPKGKFFHYNGIYQSQSRKISGQRVLLFHVLYKLLEPLKITTARPPGLAPPFAANLMHKIIHSTLKTGLRNSVPSSTNKKLTISFTLGMTRFLNLCTQKVLKEKYYPEFRPLRLSSVKSWICRISRWPTRINRDYALERWKSKHTGQDNINFQGHPPPLVYLYSTILMQL